MILHVFVLLTFIHCVEGQINGGLNITGIRLVNGSGLYEGRVELKVNGIWGTICNDSFDINDAEVLCRMLNLSATWYDGNARYGKGNGPIFATNLGCNGHETHVNQCSYDLSTTCTHSNDVSILCTKPIIPITDIRLTDGVGLYDGRVEIQMNGTWGDVCYDSFTGTEANALCNMLFNLPYDYYGSHSYYGYNSYIHVQGLNCDGDETDILECNFELETPCPKNRRAFVICNAYPLNITDIRLVNGTGPYDGRVELSLTAYLSSAKFGQGTGPVLFGYVRCDSDDYHINDCYSLGSTYKWVCDHDSDTSLICTDCGLPSILNGEITSSNGSIMTVTCDTGYVPTTYNIECLNNGTWLQNETCKVYGYPLNITDMRLADGIGLYDGRLEVKVNDTWGTVCSGSFCSVYMYNGYYYYTTSSRYASGSGPIYIDRLDCVGSETHINQCKYNVLNTCSHGSDVAVICDGAPLNISATRLTNGNGSHSGIVELLVDGTWGTICNYNVGLNEANTLCNMMNLSLVSYYKTPVYGIGSGPTHISALSCDGNYNDINQCSYKTPTKFYPEYCTKNNDLSLACTDNRLNITDMRLEPGPYHGRLEIQVNGTWGTICNNSFDINDGQVICRMINGLTARQVYGGAYYGEGKGPIHIDEMSCSGNEPDINQCSYIYNSSCTHKEDVSVVCYGPDLNITDVRLGDGTGPYDGRVEIEVNGEWGTICDRNFDINDADAFCNMLGSRAAQYFTGATHGEGTGPVYIDELYCDALDDDLNDCSYVSTSECGHNRDVSVVCNACGQPEIYYWDIGYFSYEGTTLFADCAYYKSYVGTLRMTCDNITKNWITEGECQEYNCGDPTPLNGYINSTQTKYGSVVEIGCEIGYRLEGNKTVVCELNGSWNDRPYCQYIDCQSPVPEDGSANSSSTSNGTVVEISCNMGYNLSGEAIITCQPNDNWTDYPTCDILDCGAPSVDNANVNLPSNTSTYGSVAVINCIEGYLLNGSATVTCLDDGTWEANPVCEIVDCGDPTPYKGIRNSTNTTYDSVVEISCDSGNEIIGNSTIICQADGTWSDNPVCDSTDCGQPLISNGQVDVSNGTTTGSVVSIECNKGYDLEGSYVIVCNVPGWNDTSTKCVLQDCGDPIVENGRLVSSSGTEYGDTATFECDEGHDMAGDSTITCEDGSIWSSDTVCIIRDCGLFDSPVNGYYTSDNRTTYNSTVVFDCNENYLLVGEDIMRCNSDGKWSSKIPLCVRQNGIGGECSTNDNCKTVGAVCKKSHCICMTGIYDSRTDTCDTMPLYPYGPTEGDKIVNDWERCAKSAKFDLGLPLCGKSHSRIFVCAHGTVSFGQRYNAPTPPRNVKKVDKLNRDILAPFHAHFNSAVGKVYYRSYDVLDSYVSLKERNETKDIESKIRQFGDVPSSFEAGFVLIVTWENVIPNDVDFDLTNSLGSTFQLVLVSNGEMTYSFYIYANGMMKWISKRPKYVPVWVGYHCKRDTSFTSHTSFTPSVLELDKNAVHRGVSGVFFKPLVRAENSTKNNNVSCVTWYQENKHEKQHLDLMNSWLPQCPCDISLARWDPWFWHIERWNWYNNKTFTCVDMLPGRIYRPYGKSCCYDYKTSLWIDERPIAGGFYRYHPENKVDHYKHDIIPKEMCCSPLTPYCEYYYDMRPVGTCYRESPYNFGTFWGDPHFRTLDGLSYTFNGLGEYTLLQIKTGNKTFNLQARTQRAVKSDGTLSDATIFSAFAAMDETNASFHVELNRAKNGFNIYGNGKDLTKQYNETADEDVPIFDVPHGTLLISKRGQTLVVLFPSSGISLNVSTNVEMLSLNSIVPKTFANLTFGLLGNYNEVMEDDFTLPNKTVLSANITEREIFNYGQHWEIDGEVSAFVYPEGKNHSDYHNATFIPRFLDEAAPDKIKEAEVACNGSTNVECVFDYVFTEREEIAQSTNLVKGNADQTKSQMDEVVPRIIGCESINATYKDNVSCPIAIEDGNNVEFLTNNVNASFEKDSSSIIYYQANNEPVDVRVVSINELGRSSTVFHMDILLCTGCSGNGVCTDIPRVDDRNTETFRYATCECNIDYEGPDCEILFDGCSEEPCSLNRDCHQLVGSNRTEWNRTYLCDACPDGYLAIDTYNDTCEDIDECTMSNPPCDQECTNIDGSYECSCKFGYRPDPRNTDKCLDINECEDLNTPHDCSQNCTNTEGSFNCSCYKGYTFDSVSGNCSKDDETVDDPCSSMNCSQIVGGCRITDENTAACFCDRGYKLYSNNTCIDINECDRNICSQKCNNTIGGFECSCFPGYTLIGKTTCQECEAGFWGENCENKCMCSGEGVKTCDYVKGCLCNDGWKGDTCQEDINECIETVNACNDPKKECLNSNGSFSCQCLEGFEKNTNDICEDIDECNVPSLNGCDQICKNTIGSYVCECESGFTERESTCENINECEIRTHGCEQICDDNPGAYNCFCYFGYALNDDRRTCTKLSDPCLALYDLQCSHYCYKGENSAECRCIEGFALGSDNQTCIDIDECTDDTHGCDEHADCKNTNGSYICDCSIGFKLQNDGRTCTECDDFHYGTDCVMECACLHGVCNNILGCECNSGWQGNSCDVDINECLTGQVVCNLTNEQCVNTLGSAECHCPQGYERDETNHCVDTDECADSILNACDQTCINKPGNYICQCRTGFLFKDGSCQDIDECENKKSNCEQMCENTVGSYNCLCEDGFRLNLTDRESCIASSDCLNPKKCGNHSTCFHYNDEDICKCFTGFQNNSGTCEDFITDSNRLFYLNGRKRPRQNVSYKRFCILN
ncbi:scavenger receptor [Mactra antiquata]